MTEDQPEEALEAWPSTAAEFRSRGSDCRIASLATATAGGPTAITPRTGRPLSAAGPRAGMRWPVPY